MRGTFDGNYYEKLFGHIAEVMVCDLFKQPRTIDLTHADRGFDLIIDSKRFDVKCAINNMKYKRTIHFQVTALQINYQNDGYIFVAYDKSSGEYYLAGWIDKKDFLQKSTFKKAGTPSRNKNFNYKADLYEIQGSKLNKIQKLIKPKSI